MILKAVGGEIGSASALAPKLGPLGLVSPYFYYCLSRGDVRIFIFCTLCPHNYNSLPRKSVKISRKQQWNGRV